MKKAEAHTGLNRKNTRYHESEEPLAPRRTEGDRYRGYSREDIQHLLETRLLQQLNIPIRDIRGYFEGRLSVSDLMCMRPDQVDGEMSQLKKLERICSRLGEQQALKPFTMESCLEEFSHEDGSIIWLEDVRKDQEILQKELHSQYVYSESEGEILTPEDSARETILHAARRNLDYETTWPEFTYAPTQLEGIVYQASFTFGPCFRLNGIPPMKLMRCIPSPCSVSKGEYMFLVSSPTILMSGGILSRLIDSQVGARFSRIYRILIMGYFIAAILLISINESVYYR